MAKYIGQVQGNYSSQDDLIQVIRKQLNSNTDLKIIKIGVQMDEGEKISINHKEFEIGKTEILEFEDVEITHLQVLKKQNVIIDYVCSNEDE